MKTPAVRPAQVGLICPRCGTQHRAIRLRPGQSAACAECGLALHKPSRLGPHALPALTLTALVLAFPAATLPLTTLTRFGIRQTTFLLSGAGELNQWKQPYLAALVGFCVLLAPLGLAGLLAAGWFFARRAREIPPRLRGTLLFVQHWAMPEVYILGVLVAFVKLGPLAMTAQAGLWCYAAMALTILRGWRTFAHQFLTDAGPDAPRALP